MACRDERALRPLLSSALNDPQGQFVPAHTDAFGSLVLESIDEALTDLLGRRAREAIYDYLERNSLVATNELPNRLEVFMTLLEDTFGKGSKTIGKVVAKKLYSKLEWDFSEISGYELTDYVQAARTRIAREVVHQANHA